MRKGSDDFVTDMLMKILTRPAIQELEQKTEKEIEELLAESGFIADVEVKINVAHFDYDKAKAFNEKNAKEQAEIDEILKNLSLNNPYK